MLTQNLYCNIPNISYFLGIANDPESVQLMEVVSNEPSAEESVTAGPNTTKEEMELAIFQLQKISLKKKEQIKLAMYLNLQRNTGMLLLSNKEIAQSGEVTVQDIPEGPEKKDFEMHVGEWTMTDLMKAATIGDLDRTKFLTKYGSKIDAMDARKWTALHYASFFGHLEIAEHLIANGAKVDAKTIHDRTPLIYAAQEGHLELVEYLVSKQADVNATSSDGETALYRASTNGHLEVCKYLVSKGCDVTIKSEDETALDAAKRGGHQDIVDLLKAIM